MRTLSAFVVLACLVTAMMLAFGCAKRPVLGGATAPGPTAAATTATETPAPTVAETQPSAAPATPAAPPTTPAPVAQAERPAPQTFTAAPSLEDINFDFDKSAIRAGDARILDRHADWMKANPSASILIEGHCDERGTDAYNMALGDRRAKSTMSYLVSRGVAETRMTMISYGEERPLCTEHNEACWSKNRRAHFLVKQQ